MRDAVAGAGWTITPDDPMNFRADRAHEMISVVPHAGRNPTLEVSSPSGTDTVSNLSVAEGKVLDCARLLSIDKAVRLLSARTVEDARQLVDASLQESAIEDGIDRVVPGDPLESGRYWVFFYQGRGYVESGDVDSMLIGNAPIVVPKDGGAPFALPSVRNVDAQIRALASEDSPTGPPTA